MRYSSSLRATILAATIAALGMSAQAGPMPTHTATTMTSMVQKNTTDVRWGGGGYRGAGSYGGYYDDYPAYGYASVSYYDERYCLPPLVVMPATRVQSQYLGVKPSERLPWTD
ncbi:hypothetical protein [Nitrobacter winogradskyi]|uniref:Uncharacterized protein n=2 Tax=Nitrobacter winogradskyi TaxID=913 RepID=A0ACC6AEV7_NITWI|nr:hypothetical protein [Nitrobacter winogradskyi]MCP1998377.1 hypothetical protein [Nitrobacter winogradskyi]GEC16251.1 hypothetical protein NWI01_21430 [Nitrobacter winogradskyi]